jgi:hypothetical protein
MSVTLKETLPLYVSLLIVGGAAYVPSACVVTGTPSTYQNCLQVPNANIASGILVFSSCL